MIDLNSEIENEVTFEIKASNESLTLYYRTPTLKERFQYANSLFLRKGKNVVDNTAQSRLHFGKLVVTRVEENKLCYEGKPISSNPNSKIYNENWKDLLTEMFPMMMMHIGHLLFEGVYASDKGKKAALDIEVRPLE